MTSKHVPAVRINRPARFSHLVGLLAAAFAAGGLAGCGSGEPSGDVVDTVPAAGSLSYQGKPLAYYKVTVYPEGDRPAAGVTDEEGNFTLGTNTLDDGAVVGTHPAAVAYVGPPSKNPEEEPPPPPKVKIPRKYRKTETSDLTVEIPSSGVSDLQIELN